jgi:mannose/fructose/N-acetylgalactosamine-specific phosphotransferase system component IIB
VLAVLLLENGTLYARLAQANLQLLGLKTTDPSAATLMDQRDSAIDTLAQLMDIRVSTDNSNLTTIYTTNGVELVGMQASTLTFNSQGTLNPNSQWDPNPSKSSTGTISIRFGSGAPMDLIATGSINSGQLAADVSLRDKILVQAQAQVDQLAASMASALSDKITAGTPAPAALAPKAGFDLDLANVAPGNKINFTYTDVATNTQHQVTLVRVDDRLVHGQVVVGWGRPLRAAFIVVIDDALAASDWEQELYRLGAPPDLSLEFVPVAGAAGRVAGWDTDPRPGIVLLGDISTATALAAAGVRFPRLNLGGIRHRPGRAERLPYVFLTNDEMGALRHLAESGIEVSAQDVPATRPVPLAELV